MVDHLLASPSPTEHDATESQGEANAQTNTYPRFRTSQSLSAQLWGLDFNALLPRTLSRDGTQAVVGESARIREFLSESFPMLTEEALGAKPSTFMNDAKRRYLTTACDLIELRHRGQTVGALVGAPEDWSTYYVRMLAIAREFQRPLLVRKLIRECLFAPLQACGVQRVTAETSPHNRAMTHLFGELRFYVTGQQLSDRWGPMVRYTKFLDATCEAVFVERFTGTVSPPSSENKQEAGT